MSTVDFAQLSRPLGYLVRVPIRRGLYVLRFWLGEGTAACRKARRKEAGSRNPAAARIWSIGSLVVSRSRLARLIRACWRYPSGLWPVADRNRLVSVRGLTLNVRESA